MVDEWGSIIARSRWLANVTQNALAGRRSLSQSGPDASLPIPGWTTPPTQWVRLLRRPALKGSPITLVRDIRRLCNQEWRVSFHHVSRFNNRVTDSLARLASPSNFDVLHFDAPPLVVEVNIDEEMETIGDDIEELDKETPASNITRGTTKEDKFWCTSK
ncbi:hypothetical protein V6N12_062287 [Hibiscus sabdariffa]|uniref:RNase H type-1 domain-containing protein n=1 Tax=Hibiscus sabdariffa TaxID=183260 RepID=A0ABR2F8G7_9ROSI